MQAKAMLLHKPHEPLMAATIDIPAPDDDEILIRVRACGVCRTDLHVFDGDLPNPKLPLVLGHEIVGEIVALGKNVGGFTIGQKVGVPWLGKTCGHCFYCTHDLENLCDEPQFTGYTRDGGYAQYTLAQARYCFALPDLYDDAHAAPLLCAGLIGYRAYRFARDAEKIGLYGFGAAAHILAQVAVFEGKKIFAFTKPGDQTGQAFARSLGAVWAGDSNASAPEPLDAAIIFAPVGPLVVESLKNVRKGGVVVCAGIHMSDIPSFPYRLLWEERIIRSVANLTRQDGEEFLALAAKTAIQTTVHPFPLEKANEALTALSSGAFEGAAVLILP